MIMQLQVKVYSGVSSMKEENKLFERIVDVHDDVLIRYQSIFETLKFLYGSSCVVQFNLL